MDNELFWIFIGSLIGWPIGALTGTYILHRLKRRRLMKEFKQSHLSQFMFRNDDQLRTTPMHDSRIEYAIVRNGELLLRENLGITQQMFGVWLWHQGFALYNEEHSPDTPANITRARLHHVG